MLAEYCYSGLGFSSRTHMNFCSLRVTSDSRVGQKAGCPFVLHNSKQIFLLLRFITRETLPETGKQKAVCYRNLEHIRTRKPNQWSKHEGNTFSECECHLFFSFFFAQRTWTTLLNSQQRYKLSRVISHLIKQTLLRHWSMDTFSCPPNSSVFNIVWMLLWKLYGCKMCLNVLIFVK